MLSKGLRGLSVPWLPSVQAGALSALEISDSDNKQLLVQRIGLSPFKAQPLPQSLSSSAFGVKCILPAQSSSRFTTKCLQGLLSAEAGITHPVAPYANELLSLG